jgi:Metallo-peptidase family M12B Reprolysin-like
VNKRVPAAIIAILAIVSVGAPVAVSIQGMRELRNNHTSQIEAIRTATVKVQGTPLTIRLNLKKNIETGTESVFLQGNYRVRGAALPAAADVINGKVRITFPGRIHGSRKSRQRMYRLTATLAEGETVGRLSSVPSSVVKAKTCDETQTHATNSKDVEPMVAGMAPNQSLVATIHTYADAEFTDLYGASAEDEMTSIVNTAEAIYSEQLGIRFRIVGKSRITERTPETIPGEILSKFLNHTETQNDDVDLKHLFTGKDMDGSTVGLAFVGAVCYEPSYAYAVTQNYGIYTSYIFAHEVGHNFGALHDTTSPGTLMYPYISPGGRFSQTSINQITQHVTAEGSCLDVERNGPDLSKSKITIGRINRLIFGKIVDETGAPLKNFRLYVYVNGTPQVVTTNDSGRYYTVVRGSRRKRQFVVYTTTEQSMPRSRILRFRA